MALRFKSGRELAAQRIADRKAEKAAREAEAQEALHRLRRCAIWALQMGTFTEVEGRIELEFEGAKFELREVKEN